MFPSAFQVAKDANLIELCPLHFFCALCGKEKNNIFAINTFNILKIIVLL